jgi:DNA-binding transcriptional ArsR family regulator
MTAGDIADAFDIGKPSISHHLNILKAADLVQSERDGQNIVYTLNTSVFQELVAWVYGLKKEDKPE